MHKKINYTLIFLVIVTSISTLVPNINQLQQQLAYAQSPKTPDSKNDVKQQMNQDNLCHRADGCTQANEGQEIAGNENTASGFNDQSTTNTSSLSSGTGSSTSGIPGQAGPAGATGATGATGPAGPPRTLQVVERQGPTVEIPAGLRGFSDAPCLPGELVTGGGYAYNPTLQLDIDTQKAINSNTEWEVVGSNHNTVPIFLTAFAECASLIP